ncbi:MAG: AMP-binding protein [bacterium]
MSKQAIIHTENPAINADLPVCLSDYIQQNIEATPEGRLWEYSLSGDHHSATYAELWQQAGTIVANLQARGIEPGTPAIVLLDSVLNFMPGMWACFRAGLIPIPLNSVNKITLDNDRKVYADVVHAFPDAIVLHDEYYQHVGQYLATEHERLTLTIDQLSLEAGHEIKNMTPAAADLVIVRHSSGSTRSIKLIGLTNKAYLTRLSRAQTRSRNTGLKKHLNWFALDSASGQACLLATASCYVYIPGRILMTAPLIYLDALEHFQITRAVMTSYLASSVIEAAEKTQSSWDLSKLRRIGLGAEPVVGDVVSRLAKMLVQYDGPSEFIYAGYAMAETGSLAYRSKPLKIDNETAAMSYVSMGKVSPGVSLRIVNEQDQVLEEGQIGHLQILAPDKIFSGYAGQPELTARSFTDDSWFRTGDMGFLRDEELTVSGRSKDVIIVNGKNYELAAIDRVLHKIEGLDSQQTIACSLRADKADATDRLAIFFVPIFTNPAHVSALMTQIHQALNRDPGISPGHVVPLWADQIPRTSSGKLQRFRLVEDYLQGKLHVVASIADVPHAASSALTSDMGLEEQVITIWSETLKLDSKPGRDDDFFESGGHSLLSFELITRLEEQFQCTVPAAQFMSQPTLSGLFNILQASCEMGQQVEEQQSPWPMTAGLYNKLLSFVGGWDGERQSATNMISVLNPKGTRTPVFWVFQASYEFSQLAKYMGPDQPVYGMRSGSQIIKYTEKEIQMMALVYVEEIESIYPEGAMVVAGNCQGAVIALAIAQHLVRRRRQVSRLILMEWTFPLQSYAEPVTLLFGSDSENANPEFRYSEPELGWQRAFEQYDIEFIPGEHSQFFVEPHIQNLVKVLERKLAEEIMPHSKFLPASAYQTEISVIKQPESYVAGNKADITVAVRNTSPVSWPAYSESGLMLVNGWRADDWRGRSRFIRLRDGTVKLPKMNPGDQLELTLSVTVPAGIRRAELVLDIIEEGCTWFSRGRDSAVEVRVDIKGAGFANQLNLIRRILFRLRMFVVQKYKLMD